MSISKLVDMTNEEYHASDALSSTGMKEFLRSPAHYWAYKNQPREEKDVFVTGTIVHMAVLERQKFDDTVRAMPDADKRTTAGKELAARFLSDLPKGCVAVSKQDYWLARNISDAIKSHGLANTFVNQEGNLFEKSGFWTQSDVPCRFRADIITGDGWIIDLKTTTSCTPHSFGADAIKYGYATSMAFYGLGYEAVVGSKPRKHILIAADKHSPYCVNTFELSDDLIRVEQGKILNGLERIKNCVNSSSWPKYSETLHTIDIPKWATDF